MAYCFANCIESIGYLKRLLLNIKFDVCVTVHHWYNSINNQLDKTIKIY